MPDKLEEFGGELCDCYAGGVLDGMYVAYFPLCAYAEATAEAGVGGSCCEEFCLAYCLPCMIPIRMGQVNQRLGGGDDTCSRCHSLFFCGPCVCGCMICQYRRAVKAAKAQGLLGGRGFVMQQLAAPQPQADMDFQSIPTAQVVYDPKDKAAHESKDKAANDPKDKIASSKVGY